MPKYLVLPKIGMNMEEGVISEWLVQPGDRIEKEQIVVRAETDKSVQDMFATDSGILHKIIAQVGDLVPCQGKIAMLLDEGETPPEGDEPADATNSSATPAASVPAATSTSVAASTAPKVSGTKNIRISPLAKKLAKEFNIPINMISPQKPGGRIVKADVLKAKESGVSVGSSFEATVADEFVPLSGIRKVIAKRMVQSVTTKPRVSLVSTVNFEEMVKLRTLLKEKQKVSFNELIMKACATALRKNMDLNIITADDGIIKKGSVNIGFAVDNKNGLMVPVIKNVDKKGISQLSQEFFALADKVKENQLSADDMSGATFTISNLGMFGVESFDPIINSPECFILGIGAIIDTPVVKDGQIVIQKCVKISLCFDHNVVDGAPAARLLQEITSLIENPVMMLV